MSMQALTFKDPITQISGAYVSENFKASTSLHLILLWQTWCEHLSSIWCETDAVIGDLDSIEENQRFKSRMTVSIL